MHVVENRGSGIRAMLQATREANLEPPRFDDRRTSFLVTFHNHTLMNPQAIAWLNQFANVQLNDRQRLALVYLQQHEFITNADYRRLNRVDAMVAGQELRGLVQVGMIDQHGASRGTSYTLQLPRESPEQKTKPADEEKILAYVREHRAIDNNACRTLLSVDLRRASYLLKKMAGAGVLKREGERWWAYYRLP